MNANQVRHAGLSAHEQRAGSSRQYRQKNGTRENSRVPRHDAIPVRASVSPLVTPVHRGFGVSILWFDVGSSMFAFWSIHTQGICRPGDISMKFLGKADRKVALMDIGCGNKDLQQHGIRGVSGGFLLAASLFYPNPPFFPPSGPATGSCNGHHPQSKLLTV